MDPFPKPPPFLGDGRLIGQRYAMFCRRRVGGMGIWEYGERDGRDREGQGADAEEVVPPWILRSSDPFVTTFF